MKRFVLCLCAVLGICHSGCPKKTIQQEPGENLKESAVVSYLSEVGDRAVLTLVVRPDQWEKERATLGPWLKLFQVSNDAMMKIVSAPDLWAAIWEIAALEERNVPWPRTLAGWDQNRPVVAAIGEPSGEGIAWVLNAMTRDPKELVVPGLRFRVIVPAKEVSVLLESLKQALLGAGMFSYSTEATTPEKGKMLFSDFDPKTPPSNREREFVALVPGTDFVRLEILVAAVGGLADGKDLVETWSKSLSSSPGSLKPLNSPAGRSFLDSKEFLSAYFRPWLLSAVGLQAGMEKIAGALGYGDPAYASASVYTAGCMELLSEYLWTTPVGAEFDDFSFGFSMKDGVRISAVASLTEVGEKAIKGGLEKGSLFFVNVKDRPFAKWVFPLHVPGALDAAVLPPAAAGIESAEELLDLIEEGGAFSFLHAAFRNPLGTAKALVQLSGPKINEVRRHLPLGGAAVLNELTMNSENGQVFMKGALAAALEKGYDTKALKEGLVEIERDAFGHGAEMPLFQETKEDRDIVRIGLNLDPRTIFDEQPEPNKTLLGDFELDLDAMIKKVLLPTLLNDHDLKGLAAFMNPWSVLKGRAVFSGRALVGELLVDMKGSPKREFAPASDTSKLSWDSPGLAEAKSKEMQCLINGIGVMRRVFRSLAFVDPQEKAAFLSKGIPEVDAALGCALLGSSTKDAALQIQEFLKQTLKQWSEPKQQVK
jgi:hypothetical protein